MNACKELKIQLRGNIYEATLAIGCGSTAQLMVDPRVVLMYELRDYLFSQLTTPWLNMGCSLLKSRNGGFAHEENSKASRPCCSGSSRIVRLS